MNVASRIEAANKDFGISLPISQTVVDELGNALAIRQGFLAPLQGKKGLYRSFEVELDDQL